MHCLFNHLLSNFAVPWLEELMGNLSNEFSLHIFATMTRMRSHDAKNALDFH